MLGICQPVWFHHKQTETLFRYVLITCQQLCLGLVFKVWDVFVFTRALRTGILGRHTPLATYTYTYPTLTFDPSCGNIKGLYSCLGIIEPFVLTPWFMSQDIYQYLCSLLVLHFSVPEIAFVTFFFFLTLLICCCCRYSGSSSESFSHNSLK